MIKKLLYLLFVILISNFAYSLTGSGTAEDPYQIFNCSDLDEISSSLSSDHVLMNNINCTGVSFTRQGTFTGVLNGNGNQIIGLNISQLGTSNVGLFTGLSSNCLIYDVQFIDPYVRGGISTGVLAGTAADCNVSGIYVENPDVYANSFYTGGLIGRVTSNVRLDKIGVRGGQIENTVGVIGGVVGQFWGSSANSIIYNSYSTATINPNANGAGGLLGDSWKGEAYYSFATGGVTSNGTEIGALIGKFSLGTENYNYWNSETTLQGAPCGTNGAVCTNTASKTDTQMKAEATYVGWNFTDIWEIDEGSDYPDHIRCFSSFSCNLTSCNTTTGVQSCQDVVDSNSCGREYVGDYSEFGTSSCVVSGGYELDPGTTDFSTVVNFSNVPNLIIANGQNKISWVNNVNIRTANFTNTLQIGSGYVSVDKDNLDSSLNGPAEVSIDLSGTQATCGNFQIYYADSFFTTLLDISTYGTKIANEGNVGRNCNDLSVCRNVRCSNNVVIFDVLHFDGFAISTNTDAQDGCRNIQTLLYLAFGLLSVIIIASVGFAISKIDDLNMTVLIGLTIVSVVLAIILFVGYIVVSRVGSVICG